MKPKLRTTAPYVILLSAFLLVTALGVSADTNPVLQDNYSMAQGIGSLSGQQVTLQACMQKGDCSIQHILLLANSLIRWAVGISGSIALVMYVIGGVWMIFSQGNANRISRGKDILIGTSVSLIFILGSWLIIQFALESLGARQEYQLQSASCGNTSDCVTGKVCYKNRCVERCDVEKALQDPDNRPWQCQPLTDCGFTTREDCASNPSRCVLNLCQSQPQNIVCCWTQ